MDIKKLKTFLVVADCLNLTKAAEQLGYTQPTITIQLQTLENEMGLLLFSRIGKKTFLTPSGKIVKQYIDQVFSTLQEMEGELQKVNNPRGSLTIAAPEYYCNNYLSLIIHSYASLNPQVKLQLSSYDSNEAIKKVVSNEADIGIIAGPCNLPYIESLGLSTEDLILVTTKELYDSCDYNTLLQTNSFISYKVGSNLQNLVNECLKEVGYTPSNIIECLSDETIKRTVLYQTGIALLGSGLIESELKKGALVELHRFPGKIETSMIILKNRLEEINIKSFSEILRKTWGTIEKEKKQKEI